MGLSFTKKQLPRCFKIRVGICLNSYQTYITNAETAIPTLLHSWVTVTHIFFSFGKSQYTVNDLYFCKRYLKIYFFNEIRFLLVNSITEQI